MAENITGLPAVDAMLDSVVRVWVNGRRIGSGVVTPFGLFTCEHVISDIGVYRATSCSHKEIKLGDKVAIDVSKDLALLSIEENYSPQANLAPGLIAGAIVFLVGYPRSGRRLVARTKIETVGRGLIVCNDDGLPNDISGTSGGAIFDEHGELCAIFHAILGRDLHGIRTNHIKNLVNNM